MEPAVSWVVLMLAFSAVIDAKCPGGLDQETKDMIADIKEWCAEDTQQKLDLNVLDMETFDSDECLSKDVVRAIWQRKKDGHPQKSKRQALRYDLYPDYYWTQQVIKYRQQGFNDEETTNITAALNMIGEQTCISFEILGSSEPTPEDGYLNLERGQSCLTFLGKSDDTPHDVFLNAECSQEVGEIAHQILHALALGHQHQREDRDDHVTIIHEHIREEDKGNFNILADTFNTFGLPYDYTSIMQFKPTQLSNHSELEVRYTMLPTPGNELYKSAMGQRVELSFLDSKLINLAYNCAERLCSGSGPTCRNGGYRDPRDCTRCRCPDGFSGQSCAAKGSYNNKANCGGRLTAELGKKTLQSPGYEEKTYDRDLVCAWKITAEEGARVNLRFEGDFGVFSHSPEGTCYDWVEIRHVTSKLAESGYRFCGEDMPGVELNSTGRGAMVIFKSPFQGYADESLTKGFKLAYVAVYDDPCQPVTCSNGGTCDSHTASCVCPDGYSGITCDIYDPCYSSPCENGGTCTESGNSYSCQCADVYIGQDCDVVYDDPCDPNPCLNGGGCEVDGDEYTCDCPDGHSGENCETDDPCEPNPCLNGGGCEGHGDNYNCDCPDGYSGENCQTVPDGCADHACANGGVCKSADGSYTCECQCGHSGPRCEDPCGGADLTPGQVAMPCWRLDDEESFETVTVSEQVSKVVATRTCQIGRWWRRRCETRYKVCWYNVYKTKLQNMGRQKRLFCCGDAMMHVVWDRSQWQGYRCSVPGLQDEYSPCSVDCGGASCGGKKYKRRWRFEESYSGYWGHYTPKIVYVADWIDEEDCGNSRVCTDADYFGHGSHGHGHGHGWHHGRQSECCHGYEQAGSNCVPSA